MKKKNFPEFWVTLHRDLAVGDEVRNWTRDKGYLGDTFTVQAVGRDTIVVETPGAANLQAVPREGFGSVYRHWDEYCGGELPRSRLRDITRYSKYVISIIHHLLNPKDE